MACALVFFCSLQAFLEEAGHNGETEAPIQPNHLFRILCAEESLKFVCCKPSCLSMGSSQPLVWFAVWLQYISALQAPTEAAGDNRKTEAPLHFFAWFETSLSGEIEVPDGWAPDCRVSHLVWPVLWSSLVSICFLQALPEAAGHNGETKAPVDHFFHIAFNSL